MDSACPKKVEPREQLDSSVTREQIVEALNALRRDLEQTKKRLAALEARVARQERQQAARARGGAR